MNIKSIVESFDCLAEMAEHEVETVTHPLRKELNRVLAQLEDSGDINNFKDVETAFISAIERIYPEKLYWEVVDINIFWDLLNSNDPKLTVDHIMDSLKGEYRVQETFGQMDEELDESALPQGKRLGDGKTNLSYADLSEKAEQVLHNSDYDIYERWVSDEGEDGNYLYAIYEGRSLVRDNLTLEEVNEFLENEYQSDLQFKFLDEFRDMKAEPVFELECGTVLYVDYDPDTNILYAGSATNRKIIPEYEIEVDLDASLDSNLQALYDKVLEEHQSIEEAKKSAAQKDKNTPTKQLTEGTSNFGIDNSANLPELSYAFVDDCLDYLYTDGTRVFKAEHTPEEIATMEDKYNSIYDAPAFQRFFEDFIVDYLDKFPVELLLYEGSQKDVENMVDDANDNILHDFHHWAEAHLTDEEIADFDNTNTPNLRRRNVYTSDYFSPIIIEFGYYDGARIVAWGDVFEAVEAVVGSHAAGELERITEEHLNFLINKLKGNELTEGKKPRRKLAKPSKKLTEDLSEPAFFMNTWANYNEHGADGVITPTGWMSPDEAVEYAKKYAEYEPFINDIDNVSSVLGIDENSDIEEAADLANRYSDFDDIQREVLDEVGVSYFERIEDNDFYYIQADNDSELAENYIDEIGGIEAFDTDTIRRYFDYEQFGRELSWDFISIASGYVRLD